MARLVGSVLMATLGAAGFAQPPDWERYIVVLNPGSGMPDQVAADIGMRSNGRVGYVYEHALQGFSIMVPRVALQGIARDPRVAFVEKDTPMSIVSQTTPTGIQRTFAAGNPNLTIDGADDYRVDVDVAVLDTGIDLEHPDLNVAGSTSCLNTTGGGPRWSRNYYCAGSGDDDHYHGTHVAGTIGALDNGIGVVGIAPGARLWAVKVLDSAGSGYTSGILAGIDWVVARGDIEVLNMSLGGSGVNTAYETAIDSAVENGVVVVVAAGNSDTDASNYSPAFVASAITVSALADFDGAPGAAGTPGCRIDQDDTLADFSNYGSPVDIAAPGVCILSTYPLEKGEYATISGTSMAAPHVAGAAALLASGGNAPRDAVDVQNIRNRLVNDGNFDWTDDSGDGIRERLLDVGALSGADVAWVAGSGGSGGEGGTNSPPTASFSYTCTERSCEFDASASSDAGGSIASYAWSFGDGGSESGVIVNHTYGADGIFGVTLIVTDGGNATDSVSQNVTIASGSGGGSGALLSGSENNGSTWTAMVWRADGAVMSGDWSTGLACSSKPTCTLTGISKRQSSVSFASDLGQQVTIFKP